MQDFSRKKQHFLPSTEKKRPYSYRIKLSCTFPTSKITSALSSILSHLLGRCNAEIAQCLFAEEILWATFKILEDQASEAWSSATFKIVFQKPAFAFDCKGENRDIFQTTDMEEKLPWQLRQLPWIGSLCSWELESYSLPSLLGHLCNLL